MKKLAIFFPGIGYHVDKPLLYYSRKLAGEAGYEQIALKYDYHAGNIRGNKEKMEEAFHALYAQAEAQLADVDFTAYAEVLFVSKSVGTIIASAYAQKLEDAGTTAELCHILYTPLEATYTFAPKHAVAFIGTADPWSDVPAVIRMSEAQGVPMHVYENANHSLETCDTMQNLKILQDVMEKTYGFLNQYSLTSTLLPSKIGTNRNP